MSFLFHKNNNDSVKFSYINNEILTALCVATAAFSFYQIRKSIQNNNHQNNNNNNTIQHLKEEHLRLFGNRIHFHNENDENNHNLNNNNNNNNNNNTISCIPAGAHGWERVFGILDNNNNNNNNLIVSTNNRGSDSISVESSHSDPKSLNNNNNNYQNQNNNSNTNVFSSAVTTNVNSSVLLENSFDNNKNIKKENQNNNNHQNLQNKISYLVGSANKKPSVQTKNDKNENNNNKLVTIAELLEVLETRRAAQWERTIKLNNNNKNQNNLENKESSVIFSDSSSNQNNNNNNAISSSSSIDISNDNNNIHLNYNNRNIISDVTTGIYHRKTKQNLPTLVINNNNNNNNENNHHYTFCRSSSVGSPARAQPYKKNKNNNKKRKLEKENNNNNNNYENENNNNDRRDVDDLRVKESSFTFIQNHKSNKIEHIPIHHRHTNLKTEINHQNNVKKDEKKEEKKEVLPPKENKTTLLQNNNNNLNNNNNNQNKTFGAPLPPQQPLEGPQLSGNAGRRGEYVIGAFLGGGACGKVYECLNIENGSLLAAKQIVFDSKDKKIRQRLKQLELELEVLSLAANHQNNNNNSENNNNYIVHFYGAEKRGHSVLMYLEYCPNGSLLDYIISGKGNLYFEEANHIEYYYRLFSSDSYQNNNLNNDRKKCEDEADVVITSTTLSQNNNTNTQNKNNNNSENPTLQFIPPQMPSLAITQVQTFIRQVLQGLLFIHQHHYAHLDIKTANILITTSEECRLADLGCALRVGPKHNNNNNHNKNENNEKNLTLLDPDSIVELRGTALYMSPEMIRFEKQKIGTSADIWGVGCVLMECLTGAAPWRHISQDKLNVLFRVGSASDHNENNNKNEGLSLPPILVAIAEYYKNINNNNRVGTLYIESIDFIEQCLKLNPEERVTAEELLKHPFLNC